MSLTRKLLESLGLEADKVSTIIEAHAETVDALKTQIETFKADSEQLAKTQKELKTAHDELEALKASGGDWQKKYEDEHTAFESFRAEADAKDLLAKKGDAYRKLLKDAGVSEKRIDSIMKLTDLSAIEMQDDGLKDVEALTEAIKSEWSDFITTTSTSGAKTTTPPANVHKTFSHEDIANMTVDEINANWEAISQSMKGNE